MKRGQTTIRLPDKKIDPHGKPVAQSRAYRTESNPENKHHDPQKNGNRKDPVSQHPVDANRPLLSSCLMRLDHHIPAQLPDVFVPRIGQRRLPIHTAVKLHIIDDMPDDILLRLLNPQLSHYHLIAFDHADEGRQYLFFTFVIYETVFAPGYSHRFWLNHQSRGQFSVDFCVQRIRFARQVHIISTGANRRLC